MIINKILDKNNSKLIAEKCVEWLNMGVCSSDILVLTFNSFSKKNIQKNILNLSKNNVMTDLKINTFSGLIYNTILDNWGILENMLPSSNTVFEPNLGGMEISQYILKQIISELEVKGYNSKKSLLHQIFRRYSLIVNNNLSEDDVDKRSKVLKESFGEDAKNIIQKFLSKTIELRSFDYIRQAQIFLYIYKNTDYFKNIRYLIVEDADELTPLCLDFLKSISKNIEDSLIILDKNGGSRIGYLCADMNAVNKIEIMFNEQIFDNEPDPDYVLNLKDNILNNEKHLLKNIKLYSLSKRADMLEKALEEVNVLLQKGVEPNKISVITPIQDKMLKHLFYFGLTKASPLFISGSEKLCENPLVKVVLVILKLVSEKFVDEYDLRILLSKYLGIPVKNCKKIFDEYKENGKLMPADAGIYSDKYDDFYKYLSALKSKNMTLSEKAYDVYNYFIKNVDKKSLKKFEFFIKELQSFEKIYKEKAKIPEDDILTQIENSIISENPYSVLDVEPNEIVISTPQKIIDNKIETQYQIWLDVSSLEWVKDDFGPLYNSWVFSDSWDRDEYTIEDNIFMSKQKTYKILRKLILSTKQIIALSSLFDTQGIENYGGIEPYLVTESAPQKSIEERGFSIIPREDQKPVLEYQSGNMAISAVPGAGKTTILLALVLEMMHRGINPENIFVLTYMDSAARNFKDRIKKVSEDFRLPNISTIHGLALRILKENGNFERLGLREDFEICDDIQRGNIIKSLSSGINKTDLSEFDRAISTLKLSGCSIDKETNSEISRLLSLSKGGYDDMKLSRFLKFYYNYQSKLSQEGLIDYDDILKFSVRLLEENSDILEYYQDTCEYIIEDEAQDSSSIQQRLLTLLSAKHNNLIRCGDINQAIMATFTNADVEGFKSFIETSNRVNMDCSQRCSEDIWKLANRVVTYGNSKQDKPFYEIFMHPVEGKNPVIKNAICHNMYETPSLEKNGVTKIIKSILEKEPEATVGILLRSNYLVNKWVEYINNSGLSAITRNECLGNKRIFKVIFSILKLVSEPYNNKIVSEAYSALAECGVLKPHLDKVIENYQTDFISLDNDEILDADLSRFHWDMNYWLSFPEFGIDELAMMIGLTYFSESIDKSNIYLISTLCAKLNTTTFNQTVQKLESLSTRPSLSGFKFFSEDEDKDLTKGKVQIMTIHKSKGDEFDYVFVPELSEGNMTLDVDCLKLNKNSFFMETVKGLNKSYIQKSDSELKKFITEENYRLLYVAITRARKKLYFSVPLKDRKYGKVVDVEPSEVFDIFTEEPIIL